MNRLPFLDWTRGLAVLLMFECHTFNCLARLDVRQSRPYILSQFIGGMAAVLFLSLAGVTFAFQMDKLDRRGLGARERLHTMFRRAGYLLLLAYLFRLSNSIFASPLAPWRGLFKVDILNCMGLAMAIMAFATLCPGEWRAPYATLCALGIAVASPWISQIDWGGAPTLIRDYLKPNHSTFAFFPWAAYLSFGVAVGTVLRRAVSDRIGRIMQWSVLAGFGLVIAGEYFSRIPYSIYARSDFWLDSPTLIVIRCGLLLLILAGSFGWTDFVAGSGWSWVQSLGKTSLLVYWIHVMLVYGWLTNPWKKGLSIGATAFATVIVTALMLALSVAKLRWIARRKRALHTGVPAALAPEAAGSSAV